MTEQKPIWFARFERISNGRRLPERAVWAETEEEAKRTAVADLGKKAEAYRLVSVSRPRVVAITWAGSEMVKRGDAAVAPEEA
jgi:hypothetical protein